MLRNFFYSAVSSGTAALLLILMIVAGRVLGDVEFGKFAFALLLGSIFETTMDFGLHQVTIRAIARDRSRATSLLHHTLTIKLVWATVTLIALVVTATLLRPERDVRLACYLIGGSLVFRSYMLTIRGVLQGLEHFGWDTIVVVADRALLLLLGLIALELSLGLKGLVIAFVVARGAALAVAGLVTETSLGGIGFRYDRDVWRDLHATALPLGFFLVVLNLYSYVDGVMLGVMRTDAETGLYTAAYKIYEGLTYAPMAISMVLTPRLSALVISNRAEHRKLSMQGILGSTGLGVLVGGVGFTAAAFLLTTLFGPGYLDATSPFQILCAGLPIVFAIWILHAVAISVDRERLLLKTGLVGLVVNVGLNLYLIPHYGGSGAAVATVMGELMSAVMLAWGLRATWWAPPGSSTQASS
ncbi:MAG: flippase [Acidobacteriaceae bacterium]|jgi:O-antigen/teichoic acid export membrane protein|nr:flippase [Acidobacteriaceae bacterium]